MIFPKENGWLASDFLSFEFLRCHSHFLQDPGPSYLNYLFPFNSPELIPEEHKTAKF